MARLTVQNMFFTVLIPAYNRAHTLIRALDSIEAQTFRDFDVVIVDDGSTDNTAQLVRDWMETVSFPVRYLYQENQGRHAAFNAALPYLEGELTVVLDSDDKLAVGALEIFRRHWLAIPEAERQGFCGVEGLTAFFDGTVAGGRFPEDVFDSNFLDIRRRYHIRGDKKGALRSDLLKQYPYPVFPGERHVRDSLLWNRLADHYRTRYINEIVQYIEFQPDGLSADTFGLRFCNPNGFRCYFLDEVRNPDRSRSRRELTGHYSNYIRHSLNAGIGPGRQLRDVPSGVLWLLGLPRGLAKFFLDQMRASWRYRRIPGRQGC